MNNKLICCLFALVGLFAFGPAISGAVDDLPVIKINAIDATAAENPSTDTGRVRVNRIGAANDTDLVVFYSVSGTAANGADYRVLRGSVTIRAGRNSASIAVRPIDDTTPEPDETVILTLTPDANYVVGSPDTATVTIHSDE